MRSTFWPNRIFERQRFRNRETILKFSLKHENSGLFKKIDKTLFSGHTEHVLAKSHFWESKFSKSWKRPQILFKTGKQCALYTKLYKTHFSGHAQDDSAKSHFGASKFSKLSCGLEILLKTGKQCAFYEKCTKRSFQVMRSHFGQFAFLSVKDLEIVKLSSNSL